MKSEVIFIGDENSSCHNLINKAISDIGISFEYSTNISYSSSEVADALKIAVERSPFIFLVGGLDPRRGQISKDAISEVLGLPLIQSPKLTTHIQRLCALHSIPMGKKITDLTLIPNGSKSIIFDGLDYGMTVPMKQGSLIVLPDTIDESAIPAIKSVAITTAANSQRFLSTKGQTAKSKVNEELIALPIGSASPRTLREKSIIINTKSKPKISAKASGNLAALFILLGIGATFALLAFAVYLIGAGRENPLFTWISFSSKTPAVVSSFEEFSSTVEGDSHDNEGIESSEGIGVIGAVDEESPEISAPVSSAAVSSSKPASSALVSSVPVSSSKPASSAPVSSAPVSSSKPASSAPVSSVPVSSSKPASSVPVSSVPVSSSKPASSAPVSSEPPPASSTPKDDDLWHNTTLKINENGSVESYNAYELICQVVQNETRGNLHPEAMKAQAVATYSYIKYNNNIGVYPAVLLNSSISAATQKAVDAVSGLGVFYNDKIINAVYHSTSCGSTTTAASVWGSDLPYLKSVDSPDSKSPYYKGVYSISADSFAERVQSVMGIDLTGEPENWVKIDYNSLEPGGYVGKVSIGGHSTTQGGSLGRVLITGRVIREKLLAFSIRSTCFDVKFDGNNFIFSSKGYGHGVGMSQYGAHFLAQDEGYSYEDILKHYYSGVKIK